jgi:GNAT superfamily N-acetyltransferase
MVVTEGRRELELDHSLHGQGLGTQLLLDAVERILAAADLAGGRLIAVDAIDEDGSAFCARHGFRPVEGSTRLVMKVSSALAALGL